MRRRWSGLKESEIDTGEVGVSLLQMYTGGSRVLLIRETDEGDDRSEDGGTGG